MGTSSYDKLSGDRRYSARYALDNSNGIRLLLANYNALKSRQYLGDYDATIILIDLEAAVAAAGLTDRQRQALRLVFEEDLTQAEAGKRLGVRQNTVADSLRVALVKIAAVYENWAWRDEGYSLSQLHTVENEWGDSTALCGYSYVTIRHGKRRVIR
jgi:predicted DNA-binding protein (UPF0251 family)